MTEKERESVRVTILEGPGWKFGHWSTEIVIRQVPE